MRRERSLPAVIFLSLVAIAAVHGQSVRIPDRQFTMAPHALIAPDVQFSQAVKTFAPLTREAMLRFDPIAEFLSIGADDPQHPSKTKPMPENPNRPPIDPSMVGYIDNAIIHSEIRVRFDAATHDKTPDRAEFFYAKCGCYRGLDPDNGAYDPTSPGPGPGVPLYVNFQQLYIYGEYAPMHKVSFFGQLPFRWLQAHSISGGTEAFPSSGGIGDMQVGVKYAPLSSPSQYLTFQLRSNLPSGDAGKGLGTNHATIEPMVLFYQALGARTAIEAQFGDTHPLSSSKGVPTADGHHFAGDVLTYGVGGSYLLLNREAVRMAGVLEMVGWNVMGGQVTGPANPDSSGANIVNLKIGPRFSFGAHHSLYAGYGIALTSQTWYHEIFRTEYRYAF
jgi:hypothetical protein